MLYKIGHAIGLVGLTLAVCSTVVIAAVEKSQWRLPLWMIAIGLVLYVVGQVMKTAYNTKGMLAWLKRHR